MALDRRPSEIAVRSWVGETSVSLWCRELREQSLGWDRNRTCLETCPAQAPIQCQPAMIAMPHASGAHGSQEPGARSQEPGARSQEPGAMSQVAQS